MFMMAMMMGIRNIMVIRDMQSMFRMFFLEVEGGGYYDRRVV